MLRPRLMLLDEPSFGLAPLIVREMFTILRKVNQEEDVVMLVVEQNAGVVLCNGHCQLSRGSNALPGRYAKCCRDGKSPLSFGFGKQENSPIPWAGHPDLVEIVKRNMLAWLHDPGTNTMPS